MQQRVIHLDISNQKISELRLSPQTIQSLLIKQNMVVDTGSVDHGGIRYPMHLSGEFKKPLEIEELIIQPQTNDLIQDALVKQKTKKNNENSFAQEIEKNEKNKFSLGDIATVSVGYQDPPVKIMKFNGSPAIGIQIAGTEDSNIVEVGRQIDEKLRQLQAELPIGIELHKISWQSTIVKESISGFVLSMIESIIIVLIVLLIPSGIRMGGIIGLDLILTILATFLYMYFMKIPLERMSLGALIIAMGMMVDNSIVIADGIAVNLRKGMDRFQAAITAAATPALPLLSATIIAVMSFYPIYASEGSTGEYCRTLFVVVGISLMISWFIALLMTPQQCLWFLSSKKQDTQTDEFNTPFFIRFRKLVQKVIYHRLLSVCFLLVALIISFFGFQYVVKLFFPYSTRPQLMVDYWAPVGTSIQEVASKTNEMERKFQEDKTVESVSSFIGAGPPRFYLPVDPEFLYSNYGQMLINFKKYQDIDSFIAGHSEWLQNEFPEALVRIRKYNVGPGDPWKFELRVLGPYDANLSELREVGSSLLAKIQKTPLGTDWRLDIMNPIRQSNIDYDQKRARSANISREDIANALKRGYDGLNIGLYREKNKLYKIQWRNTDEERSSLLSHLDTLPILDYAQAVSLWKETEGQRTSLEIELKRTLTSIAILAGMTPEEFICRFTINSDPLYLPIDVAIGYPAEILCQRPDLRRSLDLLFAQNARIGVATSDLLPRISFTGFIGLECGSDTHTSANQKGKHFFSRNSLTYFYGPDFEWPILNYGRLENRVNEQEALLNEGIALYRNQVLEAYKEVEDALTFFVKSIEETADLEQSFKSAKRSVDISTLQYQEGIADYSRVLNSLQLQVAAEDNMAQSQGNIGLAYANIFRSLGTF